MSNKNKQQKENDALAKAIINSRPKEIHNPITGQPYDAPLIDEHPGWDELRFKNGGKIKSIF